MVRNVSPVKLAIAANQNIKEREFWLNKLEGNPKKSNFPFDYKKNTLKERRMTDITFRFPKTIFPRLMRLSKGSDHPLNAILVSGLVVLLNKYTNSSDIIIGAPIYKQDFDAEFINTLLPLRNQFEEDTTFKQMLLMVSQTIVEATEHYNYPIDQLPEKLNLSISRGEFPLFDIVILLRNIHDRSYIQHIAPNIIFSFLRTDQYIEGLVEFDLTLYSPTTIERITAHFSNLFQVVLFNLDLHLPEIEILSEEEKRQLLIDFNNTTSAYPRDKTIPQLFEEQAEKIGHKIALVGSSYHVGMNGRFIASGTCMPHLHITYQELNETSNRLARLLMEKGVQSGGIVGIMGDRSVEMIIGILGILKAGGAYLPINPTHPDERLRYVLADSAAKILLITRILSEKITIKKEIIYLEDYKEKEEIHHSSLFTHHSDNLAYVLYTSGTTGNPKGVMIEHWSVVRLVKNTNYIQLSKKDRILQTGALDFDASTFEIWGALLNGLELYLVDRETLLIPKQLKETIHKYQISIIWMTSPLFNQMVNADIEIFQGLEILLVGGDVLSPTHINQVKKRFPRLEIMNGYGPTENTTFSTTYVIDKEYRGNIPIGAPIANSTAYIVDKHNHLVPMGAAGELVVGGDGVARGYLNNPELTAEKFDQDFQDLQDDQDEKSPAAREISRTKKKGTVRLRLRNMPDMSYMSYMSYLPYLKLYRTGDLCRWLPDGNIEFLGRIDHQVKIRGFRIEPEEIKNRLLAHTEIKETVVVAKEDRSGDKYLCAYFVSERELIPSMLREFLSAQLPDYMVPAYFVRVEKIPLTPRGKIDREALPGPDLQIKEAEYQPPTNEIEKNMIPLWEEVLEVNHIGVTNNFFELGGNSLKAIFLLARMNQKGFPITLSDIFFYQTIKELSEYILSMRDDNVLLQTREEAAAYLQKSTGIAFELEVYPTTVFNNEIKEYSILYGDFSGKNNRDALMNLLKQNEEKKMLPHYIINKQNKIRLEKKDKIDEAELFTILGLEDFRDEYNHGIEAVLKQDYTHNDTWLKQSAVKKEYLLSPIQTLQITFRTPVSPGYFLLDEYVDENIFREAYEGVIKTQGLLRSIVIEKEGRFYWREYDYNHNESPRLSVIDLTRYNLLSDTFMKICGKIVQRIFERGDIFYHTIMIRKNLRENYIIMLFNHVIFDRVSEEIMKRELLTNYHSLLKGQSVNIEAKDADGETHEKYVAQIHKGPQHITEQEVIERFYLEDFFYSKKQLKEIMHSDRVGHTTYTFLIKVPMRGPLKDKPAVEVALSLYGRALQRYTGVDKIPLLFVYEGRQYCENTYYNTIGECIDMVPMVLDLALKPEQLLHSVQERVEYLKKHNINFLNLVINKAFAEKWRQTAALVHFGKNLENIDVTMYNFLGNSEDTNEDSYEENVHQEPNPLPIDTLFNCIAFNYKGGLFFTIRCSYEIDFKKLKEMFHQAAEELYT
jgi:amino acid adenylation domain-containing protein